MKTKRFEMKESSNESKTSDANKQTSSHHGARRVAPLLNTLLLMGLLLMHQKSLAASSPSQEAATATTAATVGSVQPKVTITTAATSNTTVTNVAAAAAALTDLVDESKALEPETTSRRRRLDTNRQDVEDDIIVVTTVDGSIIGLSKTTGDTIWVHKSSGHSHPPYDEMGDPPHNMRPHHRETTSSSSSTTTTATTTSDGTSRLLQPLVSTTTTTKSSNEWRTAAVPSVDGRVYLTPGREMGASSSSSSSSGSELTATTLVRELVARAPFVDYRGRFYVGSRQATVAALDRDTGHILSVVSGDERGPNVNDPSLEGRNIIWMGRVDYSVSLYDARSGEVDVQFSTSELMGVNEMLASGVAIDKMSSTTGSEPHRQHRRDPMARLVLPEPASQDQEFLDATLEAAAAAAAANQRSVIVATPNGKVAYRNPETGKIDWVSNETFDTPVVYAMEASSGTSLGVDIVPDAPMPSTSSEYLSKELERQIEAMSSNYHGSGSGSSSSNNGGQPHTRDEEQDIVGVLASGQLFAMPLGTRGGNGKGDDPKQKPISISHSHAAATSSSLALSGGTKHLSTVSHLAAGRPHSSFHHDPLGDRLHNKHSKKPCTPLSPNFPACLVGTIQRGVASFDLDGHGTDAGGMLPGQEQQLKKKFSHSQDNALVTLHYHPKHGYLAPISPNDFRGYHQDDQQQQHNRHRRNFNKVVRILATWLPAAMAFFFVVSFEMGRRFRLKAEKADSGKAVADVTAVSTINGSSHDSEGSDVKNVGVIQVTDEVLGYGGHGTVVYKGMVEGRMVAVKRMLSAYHASANREISLLIESDGHPNVVRYFLKEVRGDFVYLALELCDMSLHDLINIMRNQVSITPLTPRFSLAVKTALLQIASGVRHLHSLRIVHRDLKPANVLLATRRATSGNTDKLENDSPYEKFGRGEYVAKISDMGLGKQLMGQSSFGLSTLNNTSLRGQSNGGESHVGGAGPGSVGWQAPEVMALRVSSEASARSDGSNFGQESSDASPADVPSGNRTSRSVDIFSLGCIFFSTLVPGCHPFGEWYEREANIMRNRPVISALAQLSADAYDLVVSMIHRDPRSRPTAKQICDHPFFWNPAKRLHFICDLSDRLESDATNIMEGTETAVAVTENLLAIERGAAQIVGTAWDATLDAELLTNVQRFRTYDVSSVRDCLRLIRNKHHHYEELPTTVKARIGSNPEGLLLYFEEKFPRLLMHCYRFCCQFLSSDDPLVSKYEIIPKPARNAVKLAESRQSSVSSDVPALTGTFAPCSPMVEQRVSDSALEGSSIELDSFSRIPNDMLSATSSNEREKLLDDTSNPCEELNKVQRVSFDANYCMVDALEGNETSITSSDSGIIIWEGSVAARSYGCRGWIRSDEEWCRRSDVSNRKADVNLARCASDPKFRTRLCNHWDESMGEICPMKKKNKCVFAHGPVELRIKEGKKNRWGKLVDKHGNCSNPNHSGGEDTYGAARSIESTRKVEGKWNTQKHYKGKK